ncbi:MAG: universal stress protein [Haloarculaceae archaeon]
MTVLVAVTDDGMQEAVVDTGVGLGRALEEELYVVYLTEAETASAAAREMRNELRADLESRDVPFSVGIEHVQHVTPRSSRAVGRQLADIASDVAISHVVVGHRSKAFLGRLVTGDVAFTLAETAEVPVTVVPDPLAGE